MAFNLGILGQVLTPAMAGMQRGSAMAEAEQYKRQRQEEEDARAARLQALRETLLQNDEARAAEMHPLQMTTERARALKSLPDFAEAPETLGDGLSSRDRLEMAEIESRIRENDAQRGLYDARRGQVGKTTGGAGGKGVEPEWQEALNAIADETRGDLAMMHRKINETPELFQLRANGTIRDYHVGAASSKARKTYRSVNRDELEADAPDPRMTTDYGRTENGGTVPFRYRKFPSEDLRTYLTRLKTQGVDSVTAREYLSSQGIE